VAPLAGMTRKTTTHLKKFQPTFSNLKLNKRAAL
jgi:hypothetical protein